MLGSDRKYMYKEHYGLKRKNINYYWLNASQKTLTASDLDKLYIYKKYVQNESV